jgi:ATP-dependent DNA ligase
MGRIPLRRKRFARRGGPAQPERPALRALLSGDRRGAGAGGLDFAALLSRLHPAASRVERLARETPAVLVVFDLLAVGAEELASHPLAERRARAEALLAGARAPLVLTPATRDLVLPRSP